MERDIDIELGDYYGRRMYIIWHGVTFGSYQALFDN